MAVKIAEEMAGLFPDFRYDRDILIGGCLCHDIGKVWEFDPEQRPAMERRSARRRQALDPPPRLRPLHLPGNGTAGGGRPLRRRSFGRGRVGAAQPREHHPAPGRLHVLARRRRRRPACGRPIPGWTASCPRPAARRSSARAPRLLLTLRLAGVERLPDRRLGRRRPYAISSACQIAVPKPVIRGSPAETAIRAVGRDRKTLPHAPNVVEPRPAMLAAVSGIVVMEAF